jgi:hypothetical protein
VDADLAQAQKIGVRGTPNFFINGRKIAGAQPFDAFKAKIEEALKGNAPAAKPAAKPAAQPAAPAAKPAIQKIKAAAERVPLRPEVL